jgi:vacuolar iron transporter family protein
MRVFGSIRPRIPEASDGILTSAGICEGFAGAGVSKGVLVFAGFAGLYVSRGLSQDLARRVAVELTAHDALAAHADAEYGITAGTPPLRDTLAMSAAFAAGALLPWLAIALIPAPYRVPVTFVVVLAGLALTGWASARTSRVRPIVPMIRTACIGGLSMLITYFTGHLLSR